MTGQRETAQRELRLTVEDEAVPAVSATVHEPRRPTGPAVLLVHGAGSDKDGAPLVALAEAVAAEGHLVVRANLPYREAGAKRRPPRADRAVPGYRQVLESARREVGPRRPWVAGGKSYGGRVASMAAAEGMAVAGLLLYGYPLHPPGSPERLRVAHWPRITVPSLFLQGTRDTFGDVARFEEHLGDLSGPATLHVVEGGDHSLRVTGKAAPDGVPRRPEEVCRSLGSVVGAWLDELQRAGSGP